MNYKNIKQPIFIVGSPRSGTTLLSAMLSNHSLLCCGPETQFFNKIDYDLLTNILKQPNWHKPAAEYLSTITLSNQSVVKLFGETNESITEYLKTKPATLPSLLESLCDKYSKKNNKAIWIEKTPNHIVYLETIRKLYPDAAIIRIMRDPRDSAHSMLDLPWTSNSYIENCYLWQSWYEKSNNFFDVDRKSITIKFEDLLNDANNTLKTLCDFLNINMQASMLDTSRTGQQVSSNAEYWKKQVSGPLDTNRTSRWKSKLNKSEIIFSDLFFCKALSQFKYNHNNYEYKTLNYYPNYGSQLLIDNEEQIINYAGKGILLPKVSTTPLTEKELILLDLKMKKKFIGHLKLISFCLLRKMKRLTTYYDGRSPNFLYKFLTKSLINEH